MHHVSFCRNKNFLRFFFLFILISVCISQGLYAEDNWKLVKNTDGIEVYIRPYKNSGFNECKGITTILAPMDIVCRILSHAPLHRKFTHKCYDSFFVKPWENDHFVHYFAFKLPWPVWDRDLVYDTHAETNPEMNILIFHCLAVKEPIVPYRDKTIRVINSEHTWILEKISPDKTRVTYQNFMDPAVHVPDFVINILTKDAPYYSLKNLRDLVQESIKDLSYKTLVCPEIPISTKVNNKNYP
jgi:hypothetical protein